MPGGEGNWTEYLKAFNGRLYRPDVAPADLDGTPVEEPGAQRPTATPVAPTAAGAAAGKVAITNPLFETTASRKK